MKHSFLREIAQQKLCSSKDKILLAVSGGIDSMVMLHLFMESGIAIGVAHANFQLRDVDSDNDEDFLRKYCEKNSIPFFVKRFETEHVAKSMHLSIQMAARELRYAWFKDLLREQHFDLVATAHHANDSVETVLLNLVRGSGLEGLDGIAPKNGPIIRPLLWASKQEIEAYAKENRMEWREDRSNAGDDYARNFIRHRVYPLLRELNPSLEKTAGESMSKISGAVELSGLGAGHWRAQFETKKGDQILFDKKGFGSFHNPAGVLWNLIRGFGFNLDQCHQVIAALPGQPGKLFTAPSYELVIDRAYLILSKVRTGLTEILIEADQTEVSLGPLRMKIERVERASVKHYPAQALLDAAKIKFPLRWRKWKPGDSFHPLGMHHKKKLSDFLIDEKVSLTDKETTTVLESGDEIVWVVGHRIDERYKVDDSTGAAIICRLLTADR